MIFIHKGTGAGDSGLARPTPCIDPVPDSRTTEAPAKSRAGRFFRVLIGLGFLGLPAWFFTPGIWTITSTQAIVNAELVTLTSPIEGVVTHEPPPLGQFVTKGSSLLQIQGLTADHKYLDGLKAEAATAASRIAAIKDHRAKTESLKHELETGFGKYKDSMVQRLTHELAEAKSEADAAEVMLRQRESEENEETAIARRSMGSQRELNQARFTTEVARRNLERARTAVARLADQLESMKMGVFTGPGDSRNDVPYSRQKIDDLTVGQLADDERIQEERARLAQLEHQIQTESSLAQRRSGYDLKAPGDGIVWRHHVTSDSSVTPQSSLLQLLLASSIFVDASLPEKFADDIGPGDKVMVRPMGSNLEVRGTVRYLIGEDAREKDDTLAARTPELGRHEVHVIIDLEQDFAGSPDFNQCFIGRRVEVRFPGITRSLLRTW